MSGLVAAGFGLLSCQEWWRELAVAASAISLFVTVPWWNTVPPGAKFGAVFDLPVLAALIFPWGDQLTRAAH